MLPGPTILSTAGTVSVPNASAPHRLGAAQGEEASTPATGRRRQHHVIGARRPAPG